MILSPRLAEFEPRPVLSAPTDPEGVPPEMRRMSQRFLAQGMVVAVVASAIFAASSSSARAAAALPGKIDYNRDVRPIFSDTCFACHGPDKNTRKANLRLDTKDGIFAALKDGKGHVIVPGKLAESEVFRRISTTDTDDLMPPPNFNKTLSERQVAIIKKWIEQGAEFKGHWAYLPVERPQPANVDAAKDFVHNPIDLLVLARLKDAELQHAAEAD